MSSLPNQFKCFRIGQEDDKIVSGLQSISMDDINPGEIILKTEYSSINYKAVSYTHLTLPTILRV